MSRHPLDHILPPGRKVGITYHRCPDCANLQAPALQAVEYHDSGKILVIGEFTDDDIIGYYGRRDVEIRHDLPCGSMGHGDKR